MRNNLKKQLGFRTDEAGWLELQELASELQEKEGRTVTLGETLRRCVSKGVPLVRCEARGEVIPRAHKLTHFQQMSIITEKALKLGFRQMDEQFSPQAAQAL